ncbi:MAG: hypothetical protein CR967_00960 [Proteobacteria bacterium]|nr:MAG: hypothetical protein CR967_00960 [Pseudomonadota bacterium]
MTKEKFLKDTKILLDFIELYCKDKHEKGESENLDLSYRGKKLGQVSFCLCPKCKENFLYSYERLQECPHEEKPRCRHCKNTCYEREKYKNLAKIMRYSGVKTGLSKLKKIFK